MYKLQMVYKKLSWIDEQFQAMHDLFAEGGIAVYRGSTEDLSNDPNLQPLLDLDVGECRLGNELTEEINKLFENRNNVGPNELVVYLVNNLTVRGAEGIGCAVHPNGKPGAVVNCNFGPHGPDPHSRAYAWLVAHEVAHVLGIKDHSPNSDNLMYDTLLYVTSYPPNLTYTDFNKLYASPFGHPCETIVGVDRPPSCC